jgi:hypothetical protein
MAGIESDCVGSKNRKKGEAKGPISLGPGRLMKDIHERGSKEF